MWTEKHDIKALADECYPSVTVGDNHLEPDATHAQKTALFRKWKQSDQGLSWREFAASARIVHHCDRVVMVQWCGMTLGIETDGYCHS